VKEKHYVEDLLDHWPLLPAHRPPPPKEGDPPEWWDAYRRVMSTGPIGRNKTIRTAPGQYSITESE
jgi:hypothetical protein